MEVTPSLTSCEFAKLDPGDLFALRRVSESYIALAVKDPKSVKEPSATDKMALILGPVSAEAPKVPRLINLPSQTRVVSFGKECRLRLPCDPKAWFTVEPPEESHCLVLVADKPCMRALFMGAYVAIQCYIDVKAGLLIMDSNGNFAYPSGVCAYTLEWTFETAEKEAREILSSRMLDGSERK